MSRYIEKHPYYYTPLTTTIALVGYFFFLWMPLPVFGYKLPAYWLWICLILIISGIAMQIRIRRVICIHVYNQVVFVFLQSFFSWALVQLIIWFLGERMIVFASLLIISMVILMTIMWFVLDQRKMERKQIPCGRRGKLNLKTGIIIEQTYRPVYSEQPEKHQKSLEWTLRASPLIAGLAIIFIRTLNIMEKMVVLLFFQIFIGIFVIKMSGETLSYLVATMRWEKEHDMQIYLGK